MNRFQTWCVEHPTATALIFGAICGYTGYNAFQGGLSLQRLLNARDLIANQELGG